MTTLGRVIRGVKKVVEKVPGLREVRRMWGQIRGVRVVVRFERGEKVTGATQQAGRRLGVVEMRDRREGERWC